MMFLIECETSKSIRGSEMETIFQESYFHSRFLDLNPYWQWMPDDLNLNELLHSCRADGAWCHWLCLWGWECNLFDIIFGRLQVQVQGQFFRQSGWWWKFTEAAGTSKVGIQRLAEWVWNMATAGHWCRCAFLSEVQCYLGWGHRSES